MNGSLVERMQAGQTPGERTVAFAVGAGEAVAAVVGVVAAIDSVGEEKFEPARIAY